MRKIGKLLLALLLSLLLLGNVELAIGIEAAPEPLSRNIPDEWKVPFSRFLAELGEKDIQEILDASKSEDLSGGGWESYRVFRVELPRHCDGQKERCLTIIGRMVEGSFVSEAMFIAGIQTNWGDILGRGITRDLPLRFYDRNFIVEVYKTSKGLIIVPKKQTDPPT